MVSLIRIKPEYFGISVLVPKRDWLDLARKISTGLPVEVAAKEAGITMEEVFAHTQEMMGSGEGVQWQMMLTANRAITTAMQKLEQIAHEGPREEDVDGVITEAGKVIPAKKLHNTDLEAAKALAKLGIEASRISMAVLTSRERTRQAANKPSSGPSQGELFEQELEIPDPWDLTSTEDH